MSFELNDFFESIKVIVDGRLNDLSYDTTAIATITDDSDKERGHYIVSDGTITYDAYVNDMNYKSGDQVRVSIMNGDWSKKKFIVGLYSEDTSAGAITYIPPLGDVFSADYSNSNIIDSFELKSNGSETLRRIWGKQITPDSSEYALQANGVYNVITLSGAFQTQLGQLSAGGYGLKLDFYSKTEVGSNERINRFITFDSSEMVGNPYSFVIKSFQQKQIAIGFDGIIDEMVLSIYQGVTFDDEGNAIPNEFYDKDNIKIPELPIRFSDLTVGFGSNLSSIEDNSLKFYTPDSTTYVYHNGEGDSSNDKRLGLIWYNKNENNGYVGYSDGVYDPNYDEIQYLKFAHTDNRLTRNIGKATTGNDELSLTLAANIEDSQPYMESVYEALTTSLSTELQSLGREVSGWSELKTQINQMITSYVPEGKTESVSAKLVQAREAMEDATQNWANLYSKYLQHGYNLQNNVYTSTEKRDEALQEIIDWFNDTSAGCSGKNPYEVFYTTLCGDGTETNIGIIAEVQAIFTYMEEQTRVDSPMAGYRSFYNNYKARVDKVLKEIDVNMSKIITTSTITWIKSDKDDDFNWFNYYRTHVAATDYPAYEKPESAFAEYANKYCMYVYRYVDIPTLVYDETEGADNTEYNFGRFLGPNWERVKLSKENKTVLNPYLPIGEGETIVTEVVDENGNKTEVPTTYNKASSETEIYLNLRMDPTKDVEKYQVVFFYNHERFLSDVLVFTNLEAADIPPQFTVSANDTIKIEHGSYSQDHYQAYSQANDLVNIVDESRRRMISCTYDGVLSGNEALAGAEVFWYIPVNSTMLTYDRDYLVEDLGFYTDADCKEDAKSELSRDGYVYFSKTIGYTTEETDSTDAEGNPIYDSLGNVITETKITIEPVDQNFCYKIKPYYEHSAQNNTIYVEAHIKDSENRVNIVKGELPLTFSSFGTNGTNYTLVFTPNTSQIASLPPTIPADELLTEDEWNALADDNRLKTIYNSYNAYYEAESVNSLLVLNLALRNGDGELLTLNKGFTIIQDDSDKEEINTQNLKINWYATNGIADSVLTLLESAEGAKERLVEVSRAYDETIPYVGVASATVEFQEELSDGAPRTLRLSTMYPIPYSSSGSYYISGPTMIVYNNQGTVSRCSDEPFKLFQHTSSGDKEILDGIVWSIEYFKSNGERLDKEDDESDYVNYIAYMPKLDYQKNTLLPAPMYTTFEGETAIIPVVVCKLNDAVVWTQPIVITQNNYASSTLNQWNGEFQVDEANGTILSTMVGAGIKTENNAFEGVLMGDIQRGANFDSNNTSGIGIYGFNDGAQSFYLGVDGRAFFGKSGRGRIYFDGNSGTIASASYLQNKNTNAVEESNTNPNDSAYAEHKVPIKDEDGNIVGYETYNSSGMLIDLDDGFIDIKGTSYADDAQSSYLGKHELYAEDEWNALPEDSQFRYTPIYTQGEWNRLTNKEHSSYEEYIGLVQPMQLTTYDDYVTAYDVDDIYIKSYKQSHIHIDAKSPYLTIHSGQQFNKDKHLMEISDSDYYLQTDDYDTTEFDYDDGGVAGDGKGFKIDLKNSLLNAYKLKITSKNLFLNSTSNDSSREPYFVIKHNEDLDNSGNPTEKSYKNLMYVGSDNYYLQSANYIPMSSGESGHMGQGMRLDLAGNSPKITAYNFDLRAGNVKGVDDTGAEAYLGSHEIIITDQGTSNGNPYFQINTVDSNDKTKVKTLVNITQTEQSLQSADYLAPSGDTRGKGMRISLSGKELKAYSGFTLKAFQDNTDNYILIDATAKDFPLQITEKFKVSWDGALTATGATIGGTINATGGEFTGTINVGGTIRGGTIIGSSIFASTLDIGGYDKNSNPTAGEGAFHVSSDGSFWASQGTIGGWSVSPDNISSANGGFTLDPSCGISSANFNTLEDGTITATGAIFNNLTVYKSLTVVAGDLPSAASVMPLALVSQPSYSIMDGGGSSAGAVSSPVVSITGETQLGGNIQIDGTTLMGGDSTVTGNLDVQATTKVNTDIYFGGNIHCTLIGGTDATGVSGTFSLDGAGIFDDVYMKFEKGILVGFTDTSGNNSGTSGGAYLPDVSNVETGKVLTVTAANTLGWTYLKKNFDLSLSGTIKQASHNYYVLDDADGGSYTPVGTEVTDAYYITGSYSPKYYYSTTPIYSSSSQPDDDYYYIKGITCNYTKYDIASYGTLYKAGTAQNYSTYTKAGDITVTVEKDAYEITLQGGDTADNAIEISITDGTASLS